MVSNTKQLYSDNKFSVMDPRDASKPYMEFYPNGKKKVETFHNFDPSNSFLPESSLTTQYDTNGAIHGARKEHTDDHSSSRIYNHGKDTGLTINTSRKWGLIRGTERGGYLYDNEITHENPEIDKKLQRALKKEKFKNNNMLCDLLEDVGLRKSKKHIPEHEQDRQMIEKVIADILPEYSDAIKQSNALNNQLTPEYFRKSKFKNKASGPATTFSAS